MLLVLPAGLRSAPLQGLAYSIGGGWDVSPMDRPGLFVAEASTADPAQLVDLLTSSLQVSTTHVTCCSVAALLLGQALQTLPSLWTCSPAASR